MSFSVLVIPEDPTLNGYILNPWCRRLWKMPAGRTPT